MEEIKNSYEKGKGPEATEEAMNTLNKNNTWELVTPPLGKKIKVCKWTFKAKYNSHGEIKNIKYAKSQKSSHKNRTKLRRNLFPRRNIHNNKIIPNICRVQKSQHKSYQYENNISSWKLEQSC